jgi:hypothetical protein
LESDLLLVTDRLTRL